MLIENIKIKNSRGIKIKTQVVLQEVSESNIGYPSGDIRIENKMFFRGYWNRKQDVLQKVSESIPLCSSSEIIIKNKIVFGGNQNQKQDMSFRRYQEQFFFAGGYNKQKQVVHQGISVSKLTGSISIRNCCSARV
ncbi:hypothetical protein CEXT_582761 [Caerostris extrusa]|uniref:Uncharacterized protein n=1 Tax=Caerostris extrusa TaxID=172846 RepID=A0AAV4YC71_CAEEX|nr:hypothetical protein CEXT_582761 [Caerostris extrusa]